MILNLCIWQVDDEGDGRPPPVFDQQAFIEAMGTAIGTPA